MESEYLQRKLRFIYTETKQVEWMEEKDEKGSKNPAFASLK